MIPALAFVPIQDLDAAFQELSDNSPPEQQPVLDWLEDQRDGAVIHLSSHTRCGMFVIESYNIWIVLTTMLKLPTDASKLNSRWTIQHCGIL